MYSKICGYFDFSKNCVNCKEVKKFLFSEFHKFRIVQFDTINIAVVTTNSKVHYMIGIVNKMVSGIVCEKKIMY